MNKLDWTQYYNEFSKVKGVEAKNDNVIFRLLPADYGVCLKLIDRYTGNFIRDINYLDQNQAIAQAENLHYKLSLGHSIYDLV